MASAKLGGKKQDEKHLKLLREMAALANNRHCFECGQRGPTYVNMTIGTFVCTACSGILRGLNPPHRVKSISMASFTPEEIDFLKEHGNEYNKHVWLGLHDNKNPPTFEPAEEHKLRDYLAQKYERKRWYMEPTVELKEQAKLWNAVPASGATPDGTAKPRTGSSLGPVAGLAAVTSSQRPPVQHTAQPSVAAGNTQLPGFGSTATAQPPSSGDLLSDLFSAPSATGHSVTTGFGASAPFPAMQNIASQPNQPSPFAGNFVAPAKAPVLLAGNSPQHAAVLHAGASNSGPAASSGVVSNAAVYTADKYAALADLFDTSASTQHVVSQHTDTAVNWNRVNWDAAQGTATSSPGITSLQQKQPAAAVSVGWGNAAPSAAMSWPGSTPAVSAMMSNTASSTGFAVQGAVAYSAGTSSGVPAAAQWGATQPAVGLGLAPSAAGLPANPFLASSAATTPFAAFPPMGTTVPHSTVKMAGYAAQGPGPASFGQQHPGFSSATTGLGAPQPQGPAVFAMQPGSFGQLTAPGLAGSTAQVSPAVAAPTNSSWAAWGQVPQPQARSMGPVPASAHTANPFAASVGSATPNSVTNPFL